MKALVQSWLVVSTVTFGAVPADGQPRAGALALDERQGDRYGWAVDYETPAAARAAALSECGAGCSVVLTFNRCGAYAADRDADSTAVGWAESYDSADGARQAALAECRARGGSGCIVRVWGCNSPVVEEGLGLDEAARRQIQEGLEAAGFDPGGADGLFGPRTRSAIRSWQSSRGGRTTGYLDDAQVEALRDRGRSQPLATASPLALATSTAEVEVVFWQSIVNSTNPADFEAYLEQFPNGVFRPLAANRLTGLRAPAGGSAGAAAASRVGGTTTPASSAGVSGAPAPALAAGVATTTDAGPQPGDAFRDCDVCPEMVVMPGGRLALGRYEVTVGQYAAFAAASGGGAGGGCYSAADRLPRYSWRSPGFTQTEQHPVTCVIWSDARAYASWLAQTTGATYRLPTVAEWRQVVAGSRAGCGGRYEMLAQRGQGTCPVGSHGTNSVGLADMVGNVSEWLDSCDEDRGETWCGLGGSAFDMRSPHQTETYGRPDDRENTRGFRVAKTLHE